MFQKVLAVKFSQKKQNNLSYNLEQRLKKHALEHKKNYFPKTFCQINRLRDIWEKLFDKVLLPGSYFFTLG